MRSLLNTKQIPYSNFAKHLTLCAAFMIISITSPMTASAETATGSATVEIRQTVAVSQTAPLNFGILNATSSETVTIAPDNTVTSLNGTSISGSPTAAIFAANGSANTAITISFVNGSVTGTGAPMIINNFAHNAGGSPTFTGDGTLSFSVGADITINDGQILGTYTGTYEVAVNYQ